MKREKTELYARANGTQTSNLNISIYGNYTYIYFTYENGTETVRIRSTNAIPEFQPLMLLPLLMIITLLTATVSKKKRKVARAFVIPFVR